MMKEKEDEETKFKEVIKQQEKQISVLTKEKDILSQNYQSNNESQEDISNLKKEMETLRVRDRMNNELQERISKVIIESGEPIDQTAKLDIQI